MTEVAASQGQQFELGSPAWQADQVQREQRRWDALRASAQPGHEHVYDVIVSGGWTGTKMEFVATPRMRARVQQA